MYPTKKIPIGQGMVSMSKKAIEYLKSLRLSRHFIIGLFALLVFSGLSQKATAQLAKGDIAFTAFNADEDGWSLVSFIDIPANTIIYFTDNEATGTTSFNTGESYFQWSTGSSAIQAGTVVRFSSVDLTSLASSVGTLTRASVSGSTNYGLSGSGDVVYAFQGSSVTSPSLILTAISSGDVVTPGDVITNAGLTTGTNAIVLRTSADYGEYNGARSGQTSFANYKSLVFGVANWTVDQNDGTYTTTVPNTTAFTISNTVNLSVSTNSASETGLTVVTVTATASSAVSGAQTVSLGVTGTGITPGDYTLSNTTITIPNGSTSGSVTFTVIDDADFEGDETAVLNISSPSSGITLGSTTSQNITITDNDPAPVPSVNLSVNTSNASEAGTTVITVTATSSFAVTGDQTVALAVTGTGITAGDYTLSSATITIPGGSTTGSVTFTVVDDAIYEGTETATLTISGSSVGITLGSTTTQSVDITDNDVALEVDLSKYVRIGRYDLPEPTRTTPPANSLLAQEVSAVTYNWDTQTLFVVGDGGTSVVQVTKTGQLINSMTLAQGSSPQGTEFYDPEGLTYVGNGKFVMSEERDRQAVLFTYVAGTTLTRSATQTVKLGTFVQNIGIEGISYDPMTNGYICVKEKTPQGIFQTGIDFDAGTATNGSATTENSINLFDPALTNTLDFADVFALSNLPALNGQPNYGNLLVLSQESGKIINVDRTGNISSSLTIISDQGNPLDVPGQQHEGLTMDRDGNLYVVSENGGGDFDHPQLWVYAPSLVPNQAPSTLALSNTTNTIEENTSTLNPIKVADIVVTDDGLGANNLTLSGPDAAFFEITGFGLFIKAGTVLDYETKTSYNITINVDDPTVGSTPDATTSYTLNLTDVVNETPQLPAIIISEVAPWSSGNSPVGADWFEVTNTTNTAIDITGWKMDDNSNSFATSVALNGITSIAAGESVIFIETADLPGKSAAFLSNWFGANPPAGLHIGSYTGSGVGLSSGGDAVNLFNSAGVLQANVTFGASPAGPFPTFNNAAGLNNAAVSQLSVAGVNTAFAAVNSANEIGSPGSIGKLFISEVSPWSSGNSPVAADWFEITNTLATAVDITGWKIDDNSGSFAASVALNGITSIAPGESVIFIETADLPGKSAAFLSNWFGANPPANLKIGSYSGSSVGLSSSGDAVNLYNSTGILQASVIFGASSSSAPFKTFDNAAGLNNTTITQLSVTGTNGAFVASADANEIGSPGTIINPPCSGAPNQPATFTAKTTFVYQGDNAVAYTVPTQPDVTYAWTFSGTGATINGTGNAVTVNYSSSATSGNLSVTANNACGASTARTLAITLNTAIALNTTNLDYSFVTVGCNRLDYLDTAATAVDPDYNADSSTANVYQLKRLFTEISHLNPLPKYLLMTGDIVMGYINDTVALTKQLTGWRSIYENHPLSKMGIQLVVIPGNHETQDKAAGKKSFVAAERTFVRVMAPYILGSNGPGVGGPDNLQTDQSKLTYSFDNGTDHFIVIDTDPVGADGTVPYKWIGSDIQNARANNARHIFAFGHKPAYSSPFAPLGGLDAKAPQRDSLWKYLEDNNCEAMFSAHEHVWDSVHPHPGKTWQVIAGNGGSRVETTWVGNGQQYYGYTLVNLYTDRKVNVMGLGRNTDMTPVVGSAFTLNEDANPTTVRNNFDICLTTTSNTVISACNSYDWNGVTYNESGSYIYTTTNVTGCDSIATLKLTINHPTSSSTSVAVCASQLPFSWNGIDRTEAGTYTFTTTNAAGCDSVATLILTVNQATSSSTSVAICASALPYSWNGIDRTEAGTYTYTTTNAVGCDSVATLLLSVNQATSSSTSVAICASALPYNWNGIDRTEAGTYTYTTTNTAGCDSVATLILSVNEATSSSTSVAICASALPYNWNGIDRNEAGTYTYTTTNSNGCDSVATLVLTVNPSPVASATAGTITCNGGSTSVTVSATGGVAPYTGTGTFAVAAGSYNYTVTDANNCSASISITVTQPNPIIATVNTGTISCFGGRVSATVTATGGSSSYKYKINNKKLQISNVFNNLAAGSYLVTVFDSEGCSGSVSFTITQPTKLSLVGVQKIKPSCKGGTNGLIQVSGVGGTGAYQYSINNGTFTSSGVFNNLHAGTYTINVIDANGCNASLPVILADGKGACIEAIAPVENQEAGHSIQISGNKPELKIIALPNPTTTSFTLNVQSGSNEEVQITVTDMMGKKMYAVKGSANQQFRFGSSFTSGMYIVQVVQGKNIQTLKIIKGKG
ncbi:MAG TPA: SdiA-regulated domain-containing protein [Panacibacter sp.]|nr:SdiA-regulated domain-containing protein [Panacibacter sp.]